MKISRNCGLNGLLKVRFSNKKSSKSQIEVFGPCATAVMDTQRKGS